MLCVSHWGFLHFFLGVALFRDEFGPEHLPPLYRMWHVNTGITHLREAPRGRSTGSISPGGAS